MNATPATARTVRDFARFPWMQRLCYDAAVRLAEWTHVWEYPIRASGDFEEMTLRDVLYWLYKTENHVRHPERGSNLDDYFHAQHTFRWNLPERFDVQAELSISAAGDLMNHVFLSHSDGLYRHVADRIFASDLPMANLECVVLNRRSESPRFDRKAAPRLHIHACDLDVLTAHEGRRFAFLSTACNHSLDYGAEGVTSTIDALRSRGIAFHGLNETAEDAKHARLMEKRGINVAVISHTFGLNGWPTPPDRPWLVNRTRLNRPLDQIDLSTIGRQVAHARSAGADFIIAQLHWGMEYEYYPRRTQLDTAHALAERGVDAVFGHHAHVIQPFEWYRTRRDPARVVPIFYSLGNLTNPFSDPRLCKSLVARLNLAKGRADDGSDRTYVRRAWVEMVVQSMDTDDQRIELRPSGAPR